MNGTNREVLIGEMVDIVDAADTLLNKVSDLTVHMRDYPQGQDDFTADREERRAMMSKVVEIRGWAVSSALGLMGEENA